MKEYVLIIYGGLYTEPKVMNLLFTEEEAKREGFENADEFSEYTIMEMTSEHAQADATTLVLPKGDYKKLVDTIIDTENKFNK